ncbi:MAG: hypothetical protein KUG77_15525 [Nannocystaceae bacterium]|nr:hypothetical protein [Nannocystaceae bacterium]
MEERGYAPHLYTFAEGWTPAVTEGFAPLSKGSATHLGDAILGSLGANAARHLTDMIVIGDGRTTGGTPLVDAARRASAAGVPVHTLLAGDARPETGAVLELVEAPSSAMDDDEIAIALRLTGHASEGLDVDVRLEELEDIEDESGRVLDEQSVRLDEKGERLPHRGIVLDARVGAAGCLRSLCTESHRASPGLRLDGFVGGNIRGWIDLGISGGWGSYGTSVETNANVLRLYGVEPAQLQLAANAMGNPLGFNPFALQVQSARLRTARVGPALRVHLIPRGRGIAYVGAGLGYSTFLADYDTAVGDVSLRFHGIDVPLQLGGGVQISEHLAAIVQFDYTFTSYPVARFDHPQQNLTLPVAFLDSAASASGNDSVSDSLPRSWGVGMGLRARF